MKAKLIFDVPEERKAFMAAVKADDMAIVLWNIVYNLRKRTERQFDVMDGTDPVPYDAVVDFIFEEIHSELEQHGINVDDLTE